MARTVDPEKHRARRLLILDAAITCFAEHGYRRATTAQICRTAGIGSGTLFHYFPTKADLLVGILELDTAQLRGYFDQAGDQDAWTAVEGYLRRALRETTDPRVPGFVQAVIGVATDPAFAAALAQNERAARDGLGELLIRAQAEGTVRTDLVARRLASWISLLVDGFVGAVATDPGFDPEVEGDLLLTTARHLLQP
jgi:AcrR family transcriptional regulator